MNLSPEQKSELERRARHTKDKHEHTRLCVILARSEYMSHELIAQVLRISVSSVYQYIAEYEKEGKTHHDARGGSQSKLSKEQTQELIKHLETYTYLRVKDICEYVLQVYEKDYSIKGMTCWLKQHGFVYKEPVAVPGKLDVKKQEAFIEEYEKLKRDLPEGEVICFIDATHPEYQSQAACGWIKKGETKTLPTTNKQFRVHFTGALFLDEMKVIAKEYPTINAENMIKFFEHLEKFCSASKIHVISDNGRANKNKLLKEYLKGSRIVMHYLPPYSPNLNPIERLWKIMREQKTYNRSYASFAEYAEAIREFFTQDIPRMGNVLKKRLNDNFQRIKPNHVLKFQD